MLNSNIINFSFFSQIPKIPIPNRTVLKKFSKVSFYKRKEPLLGINFTSDASKLILQDCINNNTANPFFEFVDNYTTQTDPAFCGSANLSILLNTLKKDPGYKWKGIWRWYDDKNIKCLNVENVIDYGIILTQWALLLKCNNVKNFKIYRPISNLEKKYLNIFTDKKNYDDIKYDKICPIKHNENCNYKNINKVFYNLCDKDFFKVSALSSCLYNNFYLMCNLGRKALNQTGDGHFTPITAFHLKSNNALLLDSARFKYNSRWYDIYDIYNSLKTKDSVANKYRGFLLINKSEENNFVGKKNKVNVKEILKVVDNFKESDYGNINKDIKYRAKILDWLFSQKGKYNLLENANSDVKEIKMKLIDKYNNIENKEFRKFIDFVYYYDNNNVLDNFIASLLFHNNIRH